MKILLSNDDGVHAAGIHALMKELKKLGDVWMVAPLEEKSTTGHSLTLHKPLRILRMKDRIFGVSGSPADSVYLGVREIMKATPDLVVSGINRGGNLGQDIYYSGTVSAAREACIMGIPSMAVSLDFDYDKRVDDRKLRYDTAAKTAVKVLRRALKAPPPKYTLLNLNVPNVPLSRLKGVTAVRQGFRYYSGEILKRRDHRGRDYFWVGGQYKGFREEEGTDCDAVHRGYAALTPVQLDCTQHPFLEELQRIYGGPTAFARAAAASSRKKGRGK